MEKNKINSLIKSIIYSDKKEAKKISKNILGQKLFFKIKEEKVNISKNILKEADETTDTQTSDLGKVNSTDISGKTKIVLIRPRQNVYVYQFSFISKKYRVEFSPIDKSPLSYMCRFYVVGMEDSPKIISRFGIGAVSIIEPLFLVITRCIELFLKQRKPNQIRFLPGEGVQFPSSFHMYIYKPLKNLEDRLKGEYSIIRGDSVKDGSAFVLKKGLPVSNIKTQSWRPGVSVKPKKEE